MTDDLVKRLRADELPGDRQYQREARETLWKERQEAADRIEKQEQALKAIAFARPECCEISGAMQRIALKTLEGGK